MADGPRPQGNPFVLSPVTIMLPAALCGWSCVKRGTQNKGIREQNPEASIWALKGYESFKTSNFIVRILTDSVAQQPLKSFVRPLMRVSLSNSILVTLIFY